MVLVLGLIYALVVGLGFVLEVVCSGLCLVCGLVLVLIVVLGSGFE